MVMSEETRLLYVALVKIATIPRDTNGDTATARAAILAFERAAHPLIEVKMLPPSPPERAPSWHVQWQSGDDHLINVTILACDFEEALKRAREMVPFGRILSLAIVPERKGIRIPIQPNETGTTGINQFGDRVRPPATPPRAR